MNSLDFAKVCLEVGVTTTNGSIIGHAIQSCPSRLSPCDVLPPGDKKKKRNMPKKWVKRRFNLRKCSNQLSIISIVDIRQI